ncbi:MAG: helix-turn-helix domain-containing protein [Candidatus Solibacter sp.]|jgi:cytoskeleton protein RodZ
MTLVGDTLRRERLKRNLDLEEISRELKISTRFLQAIENDQYDKLPGGVFAKSFVRQYARLLGLDEEAIADEVQQVLAPAPDVPQFVEKAKPAGVAPIQVPKVEEWKTVGDQRFHWSGWLSAVVLVAVMLVCSAVYAWMQRPKSQVTAQANPATPSGAQSAVASGAQSAAPTAPVAALPVPSPGVTAPPAPPAEPATAPAQVVEQTAQRKPAEATPAEPRPAPAAARVAAPNPDATVRVEVRADEAVWVLARSDGKYAFSATMDAHTSRTVEGVKDVTLRLGNAGGVTILLNGNPIGPAGPKGQVRTIQFTSGGFQIVPAKPPSAPPDPAGRL